MFTVNLRKRENIIDTRWTDSINFSWAVHSTFQVSCLFTYRAVYTFYIIDALGACSAGSWFTVCEWLGHLGHWKVNELANIEYTGEQCSSIGVSTWWDKRDWGKRIWISTTTKHLTTKVHRDAQIWQRYITTPSRMGYSLVSLWR